ncbi:MAG: heterodisulfide reductase, partial [Deltaproteobacteria bacterium]
HCGANIGRVVDIPALVEYASTLENVSWAGENLFACSTENAQQIADAIKAKGLNRVVLAACTPRTHEPLFRDTCREAGINQYFFEMANIREHCSWVHSKDKVGATQKAKDIVRMSVARAAHLEPLQEFQLPVNKAALVVGGGLAGMTSALSMAEQGFEVSLIEKDSELGGMARRISYTLEGMDVQQHLKDLVSKVYQHPLVRVSHNATITDVTGYIGNFVTTVSAEGRVREIPHGIAILATGAQEYKPTEYLYGQDDRVITQLELEGEIAKGNEKVTGAQSLVMIQCVGCRHEDKNYCSRVCCGQAVKNALKLKEVNPEIDIHILFRDMRTYGFKEDYYREAADQDIKFIRFDPENQPEVKTGKEDGRDVLKITVPDPVLGQKLELAADLLTLSAAVDPAESAKDIASLFKVSFSPDGFFQEAHVKLRPVDFSADGIFLCGTAQYPKHINETISQAYGAAGRAITILSSESVTASGAVCDVDENNCIACGACITACTYDAITFVATPKGKKARVEAILCKGDGLCNAKCPTQAIYLKHYTDDEIFAQIDEAIPARH